MNTVYTISGVRGCDHILNAGFVTAKKDCRELALKHYLEYLGDCGALTVYVNLENDTVTVTDDCGFPETFYIQTIKRLV